MLMGSKNLKLEGWRRPMAGESLLPQENCKKFELEQERPKEEQVRLQARRIYHLTVPAIPTSPRRQFRLPIGLLKRTQAAEVNK